jgi:septum formation protein
LPPVAARRYSDRVTRSSLPHCPGDPRTLVLASSSPRRRDLLRNLGLDFTVDAAATDETVEPGRDIRDVVIELAAAKARAVAPRHAGALVIAADTLVALDGRVFGKPADAAEARQTLETLSGHSHRVFTGLVLLDGKTLALDTRVVETEVSFRPLDPAEIDAYISTGEPFDKAGAYGMQGLAAAFVQRIDGDYFNVVGLPLVALNELLRLAGACLICRRLQSATD